MPGGSRTLAECTSVNLALKCSATAATTPAIRTQGLEKSTGNKICFKRGTMNSFVVHLWHAGSRLPARPVWKRESRAQARSLQVQTRSARRGSKGEFLACGFAAHWRSGWDKENCR